MDLFTRTAPPWLEPVELEAWPTRFVEDEGVGAALLLPVGWRDDPEEQREGDVVERSWAGALPGEGLSVAVLTPADAGRSIRTWVDAGVAMLGHPDLPALTGAERDIELLEFLCDGEGEPLTGRLAVDEAATYQGLLALDVAPPDLVRVYVVLARRGSVAWKIGLTLSTACPPGTDPDVVQANDHVRAGAVLGELRFL